MKSTIVLFPDYKGEAMLSEAPHGFVQRVRQAVPDATLLPVLNGLAYDDLRRIADKIRGPNIVHAISTGERKLLDALVQGYRLATSIRSEAEIVRLDTAEHPPEEINHLLAEARAINGMVVGDLDFAGGHLVPKSVDEFAHLDLFPELYRQTTGGAIGLSCAHGFQAFASTDICKQVFQRAVSIVGKVEQEFDKPVTWGFDGAMALGAVAAGVPIKVIKVKSESVRDRSRDKIASQFSGALRMCRAFGYLTRT